MRKFCFTISDTDNKGPWKCFYCGELCLTPEQAEAHFGDSPCSEPLCSLYDEDKQVLIRELQSTNTELLRERKETYRVQQRLEAFEDLNHSEKLKLEPFKRLMKDEPISFHDVWIAFEETKFRLKMLEEFRDMLRKTSPGLVAKIMSDITGDHPSLYEI